MMKVKSDHRDLRSRRPTTSVDHLRAQRLNARVKEYHETVIVLNLFNKAVHYTDTKLNC